MSKYEKVVYNTSFKVINLNNGTATWPLADIEYRVALENKNGDLHYLSSEVTAATDVTMEMFSSLARLIRRQVSAAEELPIAGFYTVVFFVSIHN